MKISERLRKGRNWGGAETSTTLGGVEHDTRMLEAADLLDQAEAALADIDCWHKEHEADDMAWHVGDAVKCYVNIGELRRIHATLAAIRSERR